jgi:hypothetical protein
LRLGVALLRIFLSAQAIAVWGLNSRDFVGTKIQQVISFRNLGRARGRK